MLRRQAARVTAVELDLTLAGPLAARLAGSNVTVVAGDATRLPFRAGRFSAAACLTMLHHIPSPELQDAALAELARVLRPGGVLAGSDGLDTRPGATARGRRVRAGRPGHAGGQAPRGRVRRGPGGRGRDRVRFAATTGR